MCPCSSQGREKVLPQTLHLCVRMCICRAGVDTYNLWQHLAVSVVSCLWVCLCLDRLELVTKFLPHSSHLNFRMCSSCLMASRKMKRLARLMFMKVTKTMARVRASGDNESSSASTSPSLWCDVKLQLLRFILPYRTQVPPITLQSDLLSMHPIVTMDRIFSTFIWICKRDEIATRSTARGCGLSGGCNRSEGEKIVYSASVHYLESESFLIVVIWLMSRYGFRLEFEFWSNWDCLEFQIILCHSSIKFLISHILTLKWSLFVVSKETERWKNERWKNENAHVALGRVIIRGGEEKGLGKREILLH